jgi:hypothetical protein
MKPRQDDFIKTELEVARMMLHMAETGMIPPIDPDVVVKALDRTRAALETIWKILPMLSLPEVEASMRELTQADTICSATCKHCGALNTFPWFSSIITFTCRECGEGVDFAQPLQ